MTPSSSPSSSTGSPPDSSPADTTFSDNPATRPSFVPLTLQSFPQASLPSSSSAAASRSSRSLLLDEHVTPPNFTSETSTTDRRTFRHSHTSHGKQYSRDSPILDMDMMSTHPASEEEESHFDQEYEHELENVQGTSGGGGGGQTSPQTSTGKKKRTRTLTTPYQSAVLHALLAQSRFPTTAMREEVGRSIGLSARKVQVWFQNQRQKARKPRTQGQQGQERAGSLDSPQPQPQFGPFNPILTAGASTDLMTRTSSGSLYSTEDLTVSRPSSDSILRGLPIPAPSAQVGSGGGTSTNAEFHLGLGYGAPAQVKIEGSSPEPPPPPSGFMKVSTTPSPPVASSSSSQHPYYTLLPTTTSGRSLNPVNFPPFPQQQQNRLPPPQPPPPSRFPFAVGGGSSDRVDPFSDAPVTLPPLRLGNPNPNVFQRGSDSGTATAVTRHDPQLRYSASFPSFSQEMSTPGGGRVSALAGSSLLRSPPPPPPSSSSSSSSSSSTHSVIPPPFTLQPRPQWDWDRPLGVVLPSIGQMTGSGGSSSSNAGTGFRQFSSFSPQQPQPRARTSSDPTVPFLEQRHSALLTQPWPLPPPPISRAVEYHGHLRPQELRYGVGDEPSSGSSSSSSNVPSPSLDSKSRNRTPDMDCQPDRLTPFPPPHTSFIPLSSRPVEQHRIQLQQQNQEEDRMRRDSMTPKPSSFRG